MMSRCPLVVAAVAELAMIAAAEEGTTAAFGFSSIIAGGVLQHGRPVAVWGTGAQPGAGVVVTLHTQPAVTVDAEADSRGRWSLSLPAQPPSWDLALSALSDGVAARTNVSFGLVLQCAGQSNMDMPVACHMSNRTQCFYPKRAFHADNGTAEVAASSRYSGKIFMLKAVNSKYEAVRKPHWQTASPSDAFDAFPAAFSAVCWYSGKSLFEKLGGTTPVGLLQTSVGGSPIEYWLPPESGEHPPLNVNRCERDVPQCDNQYNDSFFFTDIVEQIVPYSVGAFVWDQAERDVKCPVSTAAYACMQRLLTSSWRQRFDSPSAAFVAVQLPGYTGALNNGTGRYPGYISADEVFQMRLQQAAGVEPPTSNASFVATYDLSCPTSPYGSVHNVEKGPIGERIARQLYKFFENTDDVVEGPHAVSVTAALVPAPMAARMDAYNVSVHFAGGSAPFSMRPTKNCTTCCGGSAPTGQGSDKHTLDFDVCGGPGHPLTVDDVFGGASDGGRLSTCVNSSGAIVSVDTGKVDFQVRMPHGVAPRLLRYTAASIFPQCALYNSEGLPALPFSMKIQ